MGVSGISTGFPVLSQSSGQVAHVLLTRSPLGLHQCCHRMDLVRLACVRHAASVRPEPGSNSPSRPSRSRPKALGARSESRLGTDCSPHRPAQHGLLLSVTVPGSVLNLTFDPRHARNAPRDRPHWLLALTVPFSRSDAAHTTKALVPVAARRHRDVRTASGPSGSPGSRAPAGVNSGVTASVTPRRSGHPEHVPSEPCDDARVGSTRLGTRGPDGDRHRGAPAPPGRSRDTLRIARHPPPPGPVGRRGGCRPGPRHPGRRWGHAVVDHPHAPVAGHQVGTVVGSPSMPMAWHSLAGPLAQVRRAVAAGRPRRAHPVETRHGASARSRTASAVPSGLHTTLAQQCMP